MDRKHYMRLHFVNDRKRIRVDGALVCFYFRTLGVFRRLSLSLQSSKNFGRHYDRVVQYLV